MNLGLIKNQVFNGHNTFARINSVEKAVALVPTEMGDFFVIAIQGPSECPKAKLGMLYVIGLQVDVLSQYEVARQVKADRRKLIGRADNMRRIDSVVSVGMIVAETLNSRHDV